MFLSYLKKLDCKYIAFFSTHEIKQMIFYFFLFFF